MTRYIIVRKRQRYLRPRKVKIVRRNGAATPASDSKSRNVINRKQIKEIQEGLRRIGLDWREFSIAREANRIMRDPDWEPNGLGSKYIEHKLRADFKKYKWIRGVRHKREWL